MSTQSVEEHSPPLHVARRCALLVVAVAVAVGLIAAAVAAMRTEEGIVGAPATEAAGAMSFSVSGVRAGLVHCFYESLDRLRDADDRPGVQAADPRCQRR